MSISLLSMTIRYEQDVVAVRQKARQVAAAVGFDGQDQTRIATSVSEIARNAFRYAGGGSVDFELVGDTAPQAAGVIHGDFERGFIRAQTIAFEDFIKYRGEQGAKDAGRMRAEGKEYVVKDGDVLNFLFNV